MRFLPFCNSTLLHRISLSVSLVWMGLILIGCSPHTPSSIPTPNDSSPQFSVTKRSGPFTVLGTQADRDAVEDVAEALAANSPQICRQLDFDCQMDVSVELFPDQESLDRYGMNPEMQGYYAYSGNQRIQMVSPRQPIPTADIPYNDRALIAVHEYVHLVLNQINLDIPQWIDEGVAIYIGPHAIYDYTCQHQFPFGNIPSLQDLENDYSSVPAADLFSYSFIDFFVSEYGIDALNNLIRSPDQLLTIVHSSASELEIRWHDYMDQNYSSR